MIEINAERKKDKVKKEIRCKRCGKVKMKFSTIERYCQACYREMLEEYSYYEYGIDKSKIKGRSLRICEMIVEEGRSKEEIASELGMNLVYVRQVIHKNLVKVNNKGERRPF